jgi:hypothetical protein
MEILIYILIGALLVWMIYGIATQKDTNQDSKKEVLESFDKGDKWYYYKLKVKIFIVFIIISLLFLIIWLIYSIF